MSKVSIIMPTYNRCNELLKRIKEVQWQTHSNWELIIVNDCSTDSTQAVLKGVECKNIKVINLPFNSKSVSTPRNIGISWSEGDYIAPADDDVIQLPNKLKLLTELIQSCEDGVIAYGARLEKHLGAAEGESRFSYIPHWDPKEGWGIDNGQMIYRASVYDEKPLIFPKAACDWETAKYICDLGSIVSTPEPVCIYQWHGNNISQNRPTRIDPILFASFFGPRFKINFDG